MLKKKKFKIFLIVLLFYNSCCYSNTLNVAVSSNFLSTIKKVSETFEKKHNCKVIISSDSTASLFTKIKNGAPFDIFISADAKHPILLENDVFKSIVYAYGKVALWKNNDKIKKNILINLSKSVLFSIANPNLSPYGLASKNVFDNIGIKIENVILGVNINHVFKFVYSSNSEIGIVALSHIMHNKIHKKKNWKINKYLYHRIEQRMILLNYKENLYLKKQFVKHMNKKKIKNIIRKYGYKLNDN